MSFNRVILLGNLGADPEMRQAGDTYVTSVRLATNEYYTDRNGEKQTRTEWHDLEFWGKQAEVANKYLRKGSALFVEGKLKSDSWEDERGQKRKTIRIRVQNFNFLDKSDAQDNASSPNSPNAGENDDLPF